MNGVGLVDSFRERFGGKPHLFRAPARVNLIGEHTDYSGGFALPAAIDFTTWTAAAANGTREVRMWSENFAELFAFPLDDPEPNPAGRWTDYVRGVAVMLMRAGHSLPGANLAVYGNVPLGAGLSSSASVEVSVAMALAGLAGLTIPPVEVAQLCQRAENDFAGARCGIMDQFAACLGTRGHALLLDCRSLESTRVPIPPDACLVVCNSMVKRELASGAYNTRREECESAARALGVATLRDVSDLDAIRHLPDPLLARARHVITENARVLDAADALHAGDLAAVGRAMNASHRSLRDDFAVSCTELDVLADLAAAASGCHGSRMMGGGFGGCTISLVDQRAVDEFRAAVARGYRGCYGIDPPIYVCHAEDGASEMIEE